MAFQTRFANCASTVATWLTVRDTVAVDTLARLATSRMSTSPLLPSAKISRAQYTLSQFPDKPGTGPSDLPWCKYSLAGSCGRAVLSNCPSKPEGTFWLALSGKGGSQRPLQCGEERGKRLLKSLGILAVPPDAFQGKILDRISSLKC